MYLSVMVLCTLNSNTYIILAGQRTPIFLNKAIRCVFDPVGSFKVIFEGWMRALGEKVFLFSDYKVEITGCQEPQLVSGVCCVLVLLNAFL